MPQEYIGFQVTSGRSDGPPTAQWLRKTIGEASRFNATYWAASHYDYSPTSENLVIATSPSGNSATILSFPPTASI